MMTNEEKMIVQLRDCFTAGYTMPQFCIDNNIKKPLIVGINESQINFLWEIYVQFKYDKRIFPKFCILNAKTESVNFSLLDTISPLKFENSFEIKISDYDCIIILSVQRNSVSAEKIICLNELLNIFSSRAYAEIPLLNFAQNNPEVKIVLTSQPVLHLNEYSTEREKKINQIRIMEVRNQILRNENLETPYDFLGYTKQEICDMLQTPELKTNLDGSTALIDNNNSLIRIENGKRFVPNQPKNYKNKIYFMSGCHYFGVGAPFNKTIPSYLQEMLNKHKLPYCVENVAQFFCYRIQDVFYNLKNISFKPGDILFFFIMSFKSTHMPFIELRNFFDRPHNFGEVFVDPWHINELGYKAVAGKIFEILLQTNFFNNTKFFYTEPVPPPHRYGIPQENFSKQNNFQNAELEEYKKKLREKRLSVGAIVMNCNPFTLGHEYLIEYASKRVKKLFVFVVEEDKSEFKFADRFELVKRGVKKFSNVEVLPSGKFIISQQTFSGYFNKENLQDVAVDSSEDVEIFAREIAPSLGITVRFAGEEPEDSVTRQYNENMRRILPQYNIEFCEIPRREINGEIISAKTVRAALHEKNFDKVKKLVPKTTLKFLLDNFK